MRENIAICRGKSENTGEWIKGRFVFLRGFNNERKTSARIYKTLAETDCGDFYPDWYEVMPDTVGEYTGLKDSNAERIFEGDIVRLRDEINELEWRAVVAFGNPNCKDTWGWQLVPVGEPQGNMDILCWIDMEETGACCEIVGNVYDDPELLIGAKKGAERDA